MSRKLLVGRWLILGLGLAFLLLGACGRRSALVPALTKPSVPPTATHTPLPPSPTPIPLAAVVNGEAISLEEFQAELARFQAAQAEVGTNLAPEEAAQRVLEDLIARTLLAQAARAAGFDAEAALAEHWARLRAFFADEAAFRAYLAGLGFTEATYQAYLRREIAAAWMRDRIVVQVPERAEQVHVQQILLYNEAEAQQVRAALARGEDFDRWAAYYDPLTLGDLGWFPRGYLSEPALEEAAFALSVGEVSAVIPTVMGYHILRVLERDPELPLTPAVRQALQRKALLAWVTEHRSQAAVQVFVTPVPTP